ncbi:glycosyltransferase [Bacillus hominis]|uniref:glycosyltransferase n=1 Tax=Bacillus hominis TaxID=2817478 RepID=UPI003D645DAD
MKNRIIIGSPIHQSPSILNEFLFSLTELNTENCVVHYIFFDDNEDLVSKNILNQFCSNRTDVTILQDQKSPPESYYKDENTHYWPTNQVWKVAAMKDKIIDYAKENQYDYLFLIDSDLVLHPDTLQQLIKSKKDIISNIFWTKWAANSRELPQVWMMDTYTFYKKDEKTILTGEEEIAKTEGFLNMLRQPGVYKVGGLGACTLISQKAMKSGVCFKEIPNISFWGEDRHFCIRAMAMGLELYVDTHYPAYHIYRQSDLIGLKNYKENNGLTARKE